MREVVRDLLAQAGVAAAEVRAIGAHGQTVRHRPQAFDGTGYTVQLAQPALLAELTGIDVVADFRSRDVAAGGQGAPLVPAFHRGAVRARQARPSAVLNIGGIVQPDACCAPTARSCGFDCGPGNALMDAWCQRHRGQPYDDGGRLGGGGAASTRRCCSACWPSPSSPRRRPRAPDATCSTRPGWQQRLQPFSRRWRRSDVQATLAELTARRCAARRAAACARPARDLMRLRRRRAQRSPDAPAGRRCCPARAVLSSAERRPAAAAGGGRRLCLAGPQGAAARQPGNLASVTGARGARVLGAHLPAER